MTAQTPSNLAYLLPTGSEIATAATEAIEAARKATERLGRVMVVVTAAAVRDILTGCDHDAPFDAARVELAEGEDLELYPTGRYWTAAGEERTFTEAVGEVDAANGVHDMSEWTAYLDQSTHAVWSPLCTELSDRNGRPVYALDLTAAAALPID